MTTTVRTFQNSGQQPWGCGHTSPLPVCVSYCYCNHLEFIPNFIPSLCTRLSDRMPEAWVTTTLVTLPLRSGGQQPWGCNLTRPLGYVLPNLLSQSSGPHAREWMTSDPHWPAHPLGQAVSSPGAVTSPDPWGMCYQTYYHNPLLFVQRMGDQWSTLVTPP